MDNIDVKKAENCLSDLIQQTIEGNEIIITQGGRPVAKLVALAKNPLKRKFGSAKGLIKMANDFDETPEDFKDYI